MNTTMADGAEQRLDAQIAEALFGQPGMSKMDVANRVRELRGDGPALLDAMATGGSARLGDSRSTRAATFLRQYLTYLRSSPRQGLRPRWCDVYEALEIAIEALSAQPSPGGQDALAMIGANLRSLLKMNNEVSHTDPMAWANMRDEIQHGLQLLDSALAARQPVGAEENVAADTYWTVAGMIEPHIQDGALPASVHDSVSILLEHWLKTRQPVGQEPAMYQVRPRSFDDGEGWREVTKREYDDRGPFPGYDEAEWERRTLYAAPPAQAVDLGQLQRYESIGSDGMYMERVPDGRWVKLDDVLALIDGKAVGK